MHVLFLDSPSTVCLWLCLYSLNVTCMHVEIHGMTASCVVFCLVCQVLICWLILRLQRWGWNEGAETGRVEGIEEVTCLLVSCRVLLLLFLYHMCTCVQEKLDKVSNTLCRSRHQSSIAWGLLQLYIDTVVMSPLASPLSRQASLYLMMSTTYMSSYVRTRVSWGKWWNILLDCGACY